MQVLVHRQQPDFFFGRNKNPIEIRIVHHYHRSVSIKKRQFEVQKPYRSPKKPKQQQKPLR